MRRLILLLVLAFAPAVFPLSLAVTQTPVINFGDLAPNEGEWLTLGYSYPPTKVDCTANAGAWQLSIKSTGFYGPAYMPVSSMKFDLVWPLIPITDVWTNFTGSDQLIDSGTLAMTKSYSFLWGIRIPTNQQSGSYYSNITFTLTGN